MDPVGLVRQVLIGVSSGMVVFLSAAGVSLVVSGMGLFNFGQGAFFLLGALLCFTIAHVLNFWWALLLAPIGVAIFGYFAEMLLHSLYSKNMLYQMILTMGLAFFMIDGMQLIWGTLLKTIPAPVLFQPFIHFMGTDFPSYYVLMIIISGLFAIGLWLMFEKTKLGMTFRAIISDRKMVANLGIDVTRLFTVMFVFGVWLSGVAGVLMAPIMGIVPSKSMDILFSIMTVIIIGGMTSMRGAFFAAIFVGIANALGSLLLPWFYTLIPSTLMIIVLLVKPQGLFVKSGD